MAAVTIAQVGAARADGTDGVLDENTDIQVFAEITNDEAEPITLGVNFSVADRSEAVGLSIAAAQTAWAQLQVGKLPAGSNPLDVLVYAEVDGASQVLGQMAGEVSVEAAGANGGMETPPELAITAFDFIAGRVEGMSPGPGEVYDSGGGTLSVGVANTGAVAAQNATITLVAGTQYETHPIELAGGTETQYTLTVPNLAPGQAELYAYITFEGNSSSMALDQRAQTVEVIASPEREHAELGHRTIDFSLAMHTTDERGAQYLLSSYVARVTFVGDDGSDVVPSETDRCETVDGPFTCNDIVVPSSGWVIVTATNAEGDTLRGDCAYHLGERQVLALNAVQHVQQIQMTANSAHQLTEQVETEVRAGISYEFIEAEAGRTWTRGDTESWGEERSGTVLYPLDTLELQVVQ